MDCSSLLILLGLPNILEDLNQQDFLHPIFFRHCCTYEESMTILEHYQNTVRQIDIFLPDSKINLIYNYRKLMCPRISFYVYCDTEETLVEYREMSIWTRYDSAFHRNQLQKQLERIAQFHLLIILLDKRMRSETGDIDAVDALVPISQIFLANASRISEEMQHGLLSEESS
ncbi:unnamed protein product [Rotaria socialis]|uniref:Uncharacterized protein n=1 Tax=Rotaria socialis TaxID=392032 RepID=A0A818QJW8_9BILA|nr:unnamed protein product [Rotaria socialis]CAF3639946.1 unnamed protein product [Rotaria socialis]CAF4116728.1 unnamed protein product [Rotaria socialis]CAF4430049.1 unnamed protein product [Rotaria socialis]